jgi:hypothetical protein
LASYGQDPPLVDEADYRRANLGSFSRADSFQRLHNRWHSKVARFFQVIWSGRRGAAHFPTVGTDPLLSRRVPTFFKEPLPSWGMSHFFQVTSPIVSLIAFPGDSSVVELGWRVGSNRTDTQTC